MIKAIITQLKTGSITNVIPRGQNVVNPDIPYVVVYKLATVDQGYRYGLKQYSINCHFPKGYIDELDDYIEIEVVELLDGQILTTRDARKVRIDASEDAGIIVESNDDNTNSRERIFQTPGFY